MCLQAVVVVAIEENLFAGTFEDVEADMYPAAFVVLTSTLGVCMVRKLQRGGLLGIASAWLLQCIYLAKLSMLAIPEVCNTFPSKVPNLNSCLKDYEY